MARKQRGEEFPVAALASTHHVLGDRYLRVTEGLVPDSKLVYSAAQTYSQVRG